MDDVVGSDGIGALNTSLLMAARFNTVRMAMLPQTELRAAFQDHTSRTDDTGIHDRIETRLVTQDQPALVGEVTRQIPVVRSPYDYSYDDGYRSTRREVPLRRRSASRRAPAPLGLRIVVMALGVVVLFGFFGLILESHDPSLFVSLRYQPATPVLAASHQSAPLVGNKILLASSTTGSTGPVYQVPASSYTIAIAVAKPVWLTVKMPATAASPSVNEMLTPTTSPQRIHVTGSAGVTVAAAAQTITVYNGTKSLGTITSPKVGTLYTFEPAHASQ